jgi:high-affinity iron transporter
MLPIAVIIFREALEIAMILGLVLAATRGLPHRLAWVTLGLVAGVTGAGLVAVFAGEISALASGNGQEFFNAGILFTAALMIGWTALWMRSHAREFAGRLKSVGKTVTEGGLTGFSLSLIVGLALLREGTEIVLFLYGMVVTHQPFVTILEGSLIGGLLGFLAGALLYFGLIRLSVRYMLTVTGWLLMLMVAGLSAQGAGSLVAAGYFSKYSRPLWNSASILSEDSIPGKALHGLVGYSERPSLIEGVFYLVTLITLLFLSLRIDRAKPATGSRLC